jgi:hypothetical protein
MKTISVEVTQFELTGCMNPMATQLYIVEKCRKAGMPLAPVTGRPLYGRLIGQCNDLRHASVYTWEDIDSQFGGLDHPVIDESGTFRRRKDDAATN